MVRQVTTVKEFEAILKDAGNKVVLVDFYADWCGPCKTIGPIVAALESEYGNVVFLKVNVDEASELSEKYGISSLPTFLFFKNGQKVADMVGANGNKLVETLKCLNP